jgi:glyoxylase-like metal-dependent hydrolase (beta-lactamase superfamily II)
VSAASGDIEYPQGVVAVDTQYVRPRLDASHLISHAGRAAFVDTGTALAVPLLLAALARWQLDPADVDWIFLTHIHLDHAGGAGALLAQLPNARVVVHPRAAPHLADPTKLIAATIQVYGEANYRRAYGEVRPIPAERLLVTEDGTRLALAGRPFAFLHTPGHAVHHHVVHDLEAGAVYTGDTFGTSYRELDVDGVALIMPATPPTQLDPEQLQASIERIVRLRPEAVYLTHYGRVTGVERLGELLQEGLRRYVASARAHHAHAERETRMRADIYQWLSEVLDAHGDRHDHAARHAVLDGDIELNVRGLIHWLERKG